MVRPVRPASVRFVRYRPAPAVHGALALRSPAGPAPRGPGLRLVRPADGEDAEVRSVADAAVRLAVEVLAGTRPAHQLSLVAVPAVCREFAAQLGPAARGRRVAPPKVLSTRTQRPSPAVAEAVAVVVVAGRVHALALRLEHARGRWRCTALETTAP
ncbi:hypothetical protein GWI34_07480 [Actinomadura sp. DSM 109109]|nr:hypothetical protein [Actinomadura lepetitiana]